MTKEQIIKEAKNEANNDEKHSHIKLGYQDGIYYGFLEGANYVMKQLILSDVISSVCNICRGDGYHKNGYEECPECNGYGYKQTDV